MARCTAFAQLAHVACPVMALQHGERARLEGEAGRPGGVEEVSDEQRHVRGAVAQRRQLDDPDREPVVQVQPEAPALGLARQIAVRGRDESARSPLGAAPRPGAGPRRPRASAGSSLQHERHLSDLVEEQRAPLARSNAPLRSRLAP